MNAFYPMGKILIVLGLVLVGIGLLITLAPKIPYLGRLPGDIYYKRDNFVFYFPLGTSILISIILSLLLYLFTRK
ncbi:MAG TPA: DUF2905 domain-containing protein [Deltaproteobacteria bacterium]|nr:DUF2905 domain-containing protein [Deltaproteobacteria bacterium]